MAAFFSERFGRGFADTLRRAGDKDALAAQVEIHGFALWLGRRREFPQFGPRPPWRSTWQCAVAPRPSLVHCSRGRIKGVAGVAKAKGDLDEQRKKAIPD